MSTPSPSALASYATKHLQLRSYLRDAGDGRRKPVIDAKPIVWSMLIGTVLRRSSYLSIEHMVRSCTSASLGGSVPFSDDTLRYFCEHANLDVTRQALADTVKHAKRNKAFDTAPMVGLAMDGVTSGHSVQHSCAVCRPEKSASGEITGYHHSGVVVSVVGTGLVLPLDVEFYGEGDSEYAAGKRLLRRICAALKPRFAQYLVVDGKFATAPFLHAADRVGIPVVARLKENLPTLYAEARRRFAASKPRVRMREGRDEVELWDDEAFEPWDTLSWSKVRVLGYRRTTPEGTVSEGYWLTNLPESRVGCRTLYKLGKSRWQIENQVFNDAKNLYNLTHIHHHETNSVQFQWLLTFLAMTIERLYRMRFLHRGTHPIMTAMTLCRLLILQLQPRASCDSS